MGRRGWFWSLFGLLGTVATYSLVLILVAALLFTALATYNPDVFMALDDQEVEEWVTQSFTGGGGLSKFSVRIWRTCGPHSVCLGQCAFVPELVLGRYDQRGRPFALAPIG